MAPSIAPISVRLYHTLFVSGCPVEGEVELNFRALQEDDIQEVHIKLRGVVRVRIRRNNSTDTRTLSVVRTDASLWCRGGAYPPPGSDVLRIPFSLHLPPIIPPSFQYHGVNKKASVLYSVTAVGVRPGTFQFNRRICIPIAVVPADAAGAAVREHLAAVAAAGVDCEWRVAVQEEKIRRGLWGDYSTVIVQLLLPDIAVFPLFTPIPFIIKIKSVSAPLTREKADALPADKPAFPPVPSTYNQVEFKLHSKMWLKAGTFRTENPSEDVAVFARGPSSMFAEDVPPREWVPLTGAETKGYDADALGTWVQHATFQSTFSLSCPPTFAVDILRCQYILMLKVPFPGIGNNVHIVLPIMVTSGLVAPVLPNRPDGNAPTASLGLPPSYWEVNDHDWEDTKN